MAYFYNFTGGAFMGDWEYCEVGFDQQADDFYLTIAKDGGETVLLASDQCDCWTRSGEAEGIADAEIADFLDMKIDLVKVGDNFRALVDATILLLGEKGWELAGSWQGRYRLRRALLTN